MSSPLSEGDVLVWFLKHNLLFSLYFLAGKSSIRFLYRPLFYRFNKEDYKVMFYSVFLFYQDAEEHVPSG